MEQRAPLRIIFDARFHYYCGHDYQKPEQPSEYKTLLVCFDASEVYIGESDGKRVNQLYYDYSLSMMLAVNHKEDSNETEILL
jgi:hypothetical protein